MVERPPVSPPLRDGCGAGSQDSDGGEDGALGAFGVESHGAGLLQMSCRDRSFGIVCGFWPCCRVTDTGVGFPTEQAQWLHIKYDCHAAEASRVTVMGHARALPNHCHGCGYGGRWLHRPRHPGPGSSCRREQVGPRCKDESRMWTSRVRGSRTCSKQSRMWSLW